MLNAVTLDFVLEGETLEEATRSLRTWVNTYAPTLADAKVLDLHGPAGGNPVVKLVGDEEALDLALSAYHGSAYHWPRQ